MEAGPTGVIRRSHTSGQHPPLDRMDDDDLEWNGERAVPLLAEAGDVALFVSDIWHRRLPSQPDDPGRFFLQIHYGRRDLAQRLRPTSDLESVVAGGGGTRRRLDGNERVVGLHPPFFYDG